MYIAKVECRRFSEMFTCDETWTICFYPHWKIYQMWLTVKVNDAKVIRKYYALCSLIAKDLQFNLLFQKAYQ